MERRALPTLAAITGLTWMAAVLLIAADPKGLDLTGDLAYDRANRTHTVALVFLVVTAVVAYRTIRGHGLHGRRAAVALVVGGTLMLVGNAVAFWGALLTGGTSEQFWGGAVGWFIFLPGMLLVVGASLRLASAARAWPSVTVAQRWAMGSAGFLLAATTATWAISPAITLAPSLLAAFALLTMGTATARAAEPDLPATSAVDRHGRGEQVPG